MTYVDEKGEKQQPVMSHRALMGSMERFFGILVEHFAGKFPLWLAPVQVKVLPISEKFEDYALKVTKELSDAGIRAEYDERNEKIGKKIRDAQMERVNYMVIVGEKEADSGKISVRDRDGNERSDVELADFLGELKEEIESKKID